MFTDKYGKNWYKVGLHIHTSLSDGLLSPEAAAARYKNAGFDAIAITDHWVYHGEDEINGVKIISGCEYNLGGFDTSVDVMHIVGIGMKKEPDISSTDTPRQEVIDKIIESGGMAILAHPAWSLNTLKDIKPLKGFSLLEIYNTVSNAHLSSRPYSGYIVDALANIGIVYPLIATDDAHYYDGSDDTKSFIMVNSESDSVENILKAIREQKFYSSQGPQLSVRRENDKIIADCSECVMIDFLTNASITIDKAVRGENLTHAEYKIKDYEKWVRVEVHDKNENYAWSNIIAL
ncbi:MAG: PHP domain-containing protein [Clostridia bacterium]|nr:PHP domain-containing protein [Clostridia bacterium]